MNVRPLLLGSAVLAFGLDALSASHGSPLAKKAGYVVTDLGVVANSLESGPRSINEAGEVTGTLERPPQRFMAFLYRKGKLIELGTLGGEESRAIAINNRGQVVGVADRAGGGQAAFLWQQGKMQELPQVPGAFGETGQGQVVVSDINDQGAVIGYRQIIHGLYSGFLWKEGRFLVPTSSGAHLGFMPTAINRQGRAVGFIPGSSILGIPNRAVLWENQPDSPDPRLTGRIRDIGDFHTRGLTSRALGINTAGQVIGSVTGAEGHERAFLWDGKAVHTFPGQAGESEPHAINDRGQVVGTASAEVGSVGRAFLWQGGRVRYLDEMLPKEAGWSLTDAWDINNRGQIVAVGTSRAGQDQRVVLLTPR